MAPWGTQMYSWCSSKHYLPSQIGRWRHSQNKEASSWVNSPQSEAGSLWRPPIGPADDRWPVWSPRPLMANWQAHSEQKSINSRNLNAKIVPMGGKKNSRKCTVFLYETGDEATLCYCGALLIFSARDASPPPERPPSTMGGLSAGHFTKSLTSY